MKLENIGFVFGNGNLPEALLDEAFSLTPNIFCAILEEKPSNIHLSKASRNFKITQVGEILKFFKNNGVTQICLAGSITKPRITISAINLSNIKLAWKILRLKNTGDNSLLTSVLSFLESEKFQVISATEIIPSLLAKSGTLTKTKPNNKHLESINFGISFLKHIAKFDISQACIVENKCIIALEGIEGTQEMILRMKNFIKSSSILIKIPKDGQTLKIDMPTIGINTIQQCIESKISGIAIKANETIFLNQEESIALANQHNMFIIAL